MHPLRFYPERPVLIGELNPFPLPLAREQVVFGRADSGLLSSRRNTICSRVARGYGTVT